MEQVKYGRLTVFTEDITKLSQEALNSLECGDCVVKLTGGDRHTYVVSYKGEGICITYVDASRVETVSYDHTAEGWAYNSTDVTKLSE